MTPAWARGDRRAASSCTRARFDGGRAVCDGVARPAAPRAARSPGSAARASSSASSATARELLDAAAGARRGRRAGAALARRRWGRRATRDGAQDQLLLLVSRAAGRRSAARSSPSGTSAARSTTRWTKSPVTAPGRPTGRGAVAFWRAELARCYDGGAPETPQGRSAAAVHRAVRSAAAGVRRRDRRRGDGSRHDPLRDVRRSVRVLPARRVGRRHDLHQDLPLPEPRRRATTR